MAGAEKLTHRGRVLATWKCAKSSQRLDSKSMAAAHPEIAKEFTNTVLGSSRFLLKDQPKEVPQPESLAQQNLMAPIDSIALSILNNSSGQGISVLGANLS
jgi:hypothetical protein